jgi:nitrogen fixation protein FixH
MNPTQSGEFTGRHMLLVICGFFAVVISVNVVMAVSASRTWTGLVVQNSYVESQQFQEKHDRVKAQVAEGWRFTIGYRAGSLYFHASDKSGNPLVLDAVQAFLRRPVGGHDDQSIGLVQTDQDYAALVELAPGVWDVTVTTGGTPLGPIEFERRIDVP